jgi:hypothetical protein
MVTGIQQAITSYPGQDLSASLPGWLQSFERLAVKYSAREVSEAIRELLIAPGQAFFPRPDEVADEIVRQRETGAERVRTRKNNAPPLDKWKEEWIDARMQDADTQSMTREQFIANGCKSYGGAA